MDLRPPDLPPLRAKLIFNPLSGATGASAGQLMSILTELQAWNIQAEVALIQPELDLAPVIQDALARGIRLFIASGGDGTVDSVAAQLFRLNRRATLGIIPTGTQNNVALSLGIPVEIPAAAAILRRGRRIRVDMGVATCGEVERPFLEVCSVGLLSALFPAADEIQRGNLARIGDLLATLVNFPPASVRLVFERGLALDLQGNIVIIGNMPFAGPHYQVAPEDSFSDGMLDLLFFSSITMFDLIGAAIQAGSSVDDPRIRRYQVRSVTVDTQPPMPVMVDGSTIGQGPLNASVCRKALAVMVPAHA